MAYCKNCGQPLEQPEGCKVCGCPVNMGGAYCGECGTKRVPNSVFCVECGHPFEAGMPQSQPEKPARSRYAAAAFGIVMGCFGVHSFYLGNPLKGMFQIVITLAAWLLVMLGVIPAFAGLLLGALWGFIEGVLILVGDVKTDSAGKALRDWNK